MTTIYVNSGAAGLNNGTSWANAYTSLNSATGAAAGDVVKVHNAHAQTLGVTSTFANGTRTNPVKIICVDKDNSDALSTGGSITYSAANIGLNGNIKVYGLTIVGSAAGGTPCVYGPTEGKCEFESCTFSQTSTGLIWPGFNTGRCINRFINCTFTLASGTGTGVGVIIQGQDGSLLEFFGCTFTARSTQTNFFRIDGNTGINARLYGCTFTGTVTNMFDITTNRSFAEMWFDYCTLPTYTNVFDVAATHCRSRVEFRNSIGGTITEPVIGPTLITDLLGTITISTTKYRDNGASDGFSNYSLVMATNANALEPYGYLESPPLVRKVAAAGSYTVTVYIAGGATLQDDEIFVELLSPSEAGTPTPTARFQTSRMANLGTAANLTTDGTSTWTGTGVGTKQKVSFSIAPTVAGVVIAKVFLTKASTTVYIDAALEVA